MESVILLSHKFQKISYQKSILEYLKFFKEI